MISFPTNTRIRQLVNTLDIIVGDTNFLCCNITLFLIAYTLVIIVIFVRDCTSNKSRCNEKRIVDLVTVMGPGKAISRINFIKCSYNILRPV